MKETLTKEKFQLLLSKEIKKNNPAANKPTPFYFFIKDIGKIRKNTSMEWHKELYPVILGNITGIVLEKTADDINSDSYAYLYDKHLSAEMIIKDNEEMRKQIQELASVSMGGTKVENEVIVTTQQDVNNAKLVIARLSAQISKNMEILSGWFGYNVPTKVNLEHKINTKPDLSNVTYKELKQVLDKIKPT